MKDLEKKQLNKEMDKIFNQLEINTESDEDFLAKNNFSWDDLNSLKEELGKNILEFIFQVNSILDRKDVIDNLGKNKEEFNKTIETFFSDINNFSKKIKELSDIHNGKTGPITTIEDFNEYNRLSIQYNVCATELLELISPALSNLVLIVAEIASKIENNKQNNQPLEHKKGE